MEGLRFIVSVVAFVIFLVGFGNSFMIGGDPYHRRETLDPQGKYELEWKVDWTEKRITFNVTCETRGYVGFGLSKNGKMSGADIVIGGVGRNDNVYFSDRHAVGNHLSEVDPSQDWKLHGAWQQGKKTFLSFSRDLDTCDEQDYPITEVRVALIWAYSEKDNEIEYHHQNRGVFNIYLLHPDHSPKIDHDPKKGMVNEVGEEHKDMKVWTISQTLEIPSGDTTYWCTIHQGPKLPRKHHIIGMELRFEDEVSRRHVHHMSLFKCNAPIGQNQRSLFSPFLGQRGQRCVGLFNPRGPMPTHLCNELNQGWAVNGRMYFNPPHVGDPVGADPEEYYMLQVHYDNPNMLPNIVVDMKLDMFYTSKLRPHEAGILPIRTPSPGMTPSILVPPSSTAHANYAHCMPDCTRRMFPKEGITIFGTMLHTHNSGRAIRVQHFRGNKELQWIENDDNFGFDFQQFRNLNKERLVLPGDQLTIRCVYDNTWTNGTVVGGFSSRQEMCLAFVRYYSKIRDFQLCGSKFTTAESRQRFLGVENVTWSDSRLEFMTDPPHPLAGLTMTEISDNYVNWDLRKRAELQRFHLRETQTGVCAKEIYALNPYPEYLERDKDGFFINPDEFPLPARYPVVAQPYRRGESCGLRKK